LALGGGGGGSAFYPLEGPLKVTLSGPDYLQSLLITGCLSVDPEPLLNMSQSCLESVVLVWKEALLLSATREMGKNKEVNSLGSS